MATNSPIRISCGDVEVVMGWGDFLKHLEIFATPYTCMFFYCFLFAIDILVWEVSKFLTSLPLLQNPGIAA